jgi:hypothetical protein
MGVKSPADAGIGDVYDQCSGYFLPALSWLSQVLYAFPQQAKAALDIMRCKTAPSERMYLNAMNAPWNDLLQFLKNYYQQKQLAFYGNAKQ